MDASQQLIGGVLIMMALILLARLLLKKGLLNKDHSSLFSNLVLKVTLPAVIFYSLAIKSFNSDYLIMAGIMAAIETGMIIIALAIATILKFDKGEKGALILVSAFGMTSMLGYPIIRQVFPGNALAMEETVITSEFGVGLLLFILGPFIAMYYGDSKVKGKSIIASAKKFFVSPIFFALIAGIGFSFVPLNHNSEAFGTFIRFFKIVGHANTVMVTFTIGLILKFKRVSHIYLFLTIAVILKLIIKPLLSVWLTNNGHFTDMMREIVLIETALPSALLTAIFAKQYNCRPDLVSVAIMTTLVLSVLSVSLIFVTFF